MNYIPSGFCGGKDLEYPILYFLLFLSFFPLPKTFSRGIVLYSQESTSNKDPNSVYIQGKQSTNTVKVAAIPVR